MKNSFRKTLIMIIIPIVSSLFLIGSGFSIWVFNNGIKDQANGSINVTTTGQKEIGRFYKNYSSTSSEEDTSNKTNYLMVNETSLSFLYDYYIHLDFSDDLPSSGMIYFTFDLTINTIKTQLDTTLFPPSTYSWPNDGYLSMDEMIVIYTQTVDIDSQPNKITYFPVVENGLNDEGYYSQTISFTNQTWKYAINLANSSVAGTSIILESSQQFDINYKSDYLSYDDEHKEEILKKARIIMNHTSLNISYKVTYVA